MEENEEKLEVKNPAHLLARKLQENRKSLHIARVPDKTKKEFMELADKEFCGDYGMALKWIMDDIPNQDIRMVVSNIENHEARIQALESIGSETIEEEPKPIVKTVGGNKIVKRGSNKNG